MVARDRGACDARKLAWVDCLLDGDHGGAAFHRADADEDGVPGLQRCFMKPENPGVQAAGVARCRVGVGDDVATLKEQLAVERDADRTARTLRPAERCLWPAFNGLDLGDLA